MSSGKEGQSEVRGMDFFFRHHQPQAYEQAKSTE